jgi:hypothetical protein
MIVQVICRPDGEIVLVKEDRALATSPALAGHNFEGEFLGRAKLLLLDDQGIEKPA